MSIAGGWHDAADLTQGTGNTAESCIALLDMAGAVQGKDSIFYERLLEEARWGVNWILRTRFGDGYRLGGLIIGIWTRISVVTRRHADRSTKYAYGQSESRFQLRTRRPSF